MESCTHASAIKHARTQTHLGLDDIRSDATEQNLVEIILTAGRIGFNYKVEGGAACVQSSENRGEG